MINEEEKKGPSKKSRCGKFQISVWKKTRRIAARDDFDAEREIKIHRVCIQHSRFNNAEQKWANQRVWCSPDEILDLVRAIDDLDEVD